MKNKKAEMTLTALVTIVITCLLLIATINAAVKYSSKTSNKHKLDPVIKLAEKIDAFNFTENPDKEFYGQNQRFVLGQNELFLFFSAGNDPILLRHDPKFKGPSTDTSNVDPNHWLEFERPVNESCKDTACICHCEAPRNFLVKSDNKPYLVPTVLTLSNSTNSRPFECTKLTCKSVGEKGDEALLFGNSRGIDDEYIENVTKTAQNLNYGKKETFYPIPMDMVLLAQNRASNDGNLFFSGMCDGENQPINIDDCYNYVRQDPGYLKMLLEEYYWEGGVVIGGMAFAKDSSDMDDYMLRDAPITLRLEKIKGHENIIGVCIHDKCLYDKQLEKLSGSQASQQELIEFKEKATNKFIEFELYLRQEFVPDIVSIKASDDKTKQEKILTKFRSELNSMFVAMPETQGIVSTIVFEFDPSNKEITKAALYVNGIKVKEGTVLSMPFPYGSDNKQYEKNIVITNFEGGKVTLSDGSTKIINAIPHGTKLIKTLKFE